MTLEGLGIRESGIGNRECAVCAGAQDAVLFGKLAGTASRLKPLQQRSGNASSVIEARVACSPLFVGAPSGAMLLVQLRKSIAAEAASYTEREEAVSCPSRSRIARVGRARLSV